MDYMSPKQQFSSAYDVLSYIHLHFGEDRMRDAKQLQGLFDDLAPELLRERKQLSYLLQCNGHILLLNGKATSREQQDSICERIIAQMVRDYLLDRKVCEEIVYAFRDSISSEIRSSTQSSNVGAQTFTWDDENSMGNEKDSQQIPSGLTDNGNQIAGNNYYIPGINQSASQTKIYAHGNRKWIVIALCLVLVIGVIYYVANPQREIDAAAKPLYVSAEQDVQNGKFDSAISTLDSIDPSWKDYNKVLALKEDAVRGILLDRADEMLKRREYKALLILINDNVASITSDPVIKTMYDQAASNYRNEVIQEAENALSSAGYETAISIINSGLSVLTNDSILHAKKEVYATYAPVDLTDLPFYYDGGLVIEKNGLTDTRGTTYRTGIHWREGVFSLHVNSAVWDIGGKYNKLTATGIILDKHGSSYYDGEYGSYKIYGDDVLLYEKTNIVNTTKPYQIEVDITGVTDLKIEMTVSSAGWPVWPVLVDVMLQKTK